MNAAAILKAKLRAAGVRFRREGTRLIVEAPAGVITAQLHTELANRKTELIAALEAEALSMTEDPAATEATGEIAGLLAGAYRRYTAVQRVPANRSGDPRDAELALSVEPSVHGVVP